MKQAQIEVFFRISDYSRIFDVLASDEVINSLLSTFSPPVFWRIPESIEIADLKLNVLGDIDMLLCSDREMLYENKIYSRVIFEKHYLVGW